MTRVQIWTDAGGQNPGQTAWAAVLVSRGLALVVGGKINWSTVNYAEAMAAVQGLKRLKSPSQVEIITDSQYVVNGVKRFILGRGPLKTNPEVWKQFWKVAKPHKINIRYVPGHQDDQLNRIAHNYAAWCGNTGKSLELRMPLDELLWIAPQKKRGIEMALAVGSDLLFKLCEQLGLDPKKTANINIDVPASGLVMVSVESFVEPGELPEDVLGQLVSKADIILDD